MLRAQGAASVGIDPPTSSAALGGSICSTCGVQTGDGLADWEMHQNVGLDLPVQSLQMQIGPALFSYIFGSWNQLPNGPAPRAGAKFPAFPADAASWTSTPSSRPALGPGLSPRCNRCA